MVENLSITFFFEILLQLFNGFLNETSNSPLIETHNEFFCEIQFFFMSYCATVASVFCIEQPD
jgi:hypothetical protein